MAQIRPFQFFNAQGLPLANGKIYVTKPNQSPSDPNALLQITDADSGEVFGGTFRTDAYGFPIGVNGNRINPTVVESAWGLYIEDADGGMVYQYPRQVSDALGVSGGSGADSPVDAVVNNFELAKVTDLTGKNFIFIQSTVAGWEGTADGPVKSYYAHLTGSSGTPSTGTYDLFYDSVGNEFKISEVSVETYDYNVPTGAVMEWYTDTAPAGFIFARGQAVSRTDYADLFALWGVMFGAGDGSTTFNVIDKRGLVSRGVDDGAGVDPDAATRTDRGDGTTGDAVGTRQDDENKAHSHTGTAASAGSHSHTLPRFDNGTGVAVQHGTSEFEDSSPLLANTSTAGAHSHTLSINNDGGSESRMKNIYANFIIKT